MIGAVDSNFVVCTDTQHCMCNVCSADITDITLPSIRPSVHEITEIVSCTVEYSEARFVVSLRLTVADSQSFHVLVTLML